MQIFIALVLAIAAGLLMQNHSAFAAEYIKPFGTIFLNLVKFIVGPIVLFSIMSGVISLKDIHKVESIGGITVCYYFCTTAVATVIGLMIAHLFRGFFPVLETSSLVYEAPASGSPMDVIVNIFPSNFLAPITEANMLQVIVMALLIGFAVILLGESASEAVNGINRWNDIFMKVMEMILKLSPVGVFALLCPVIAENGPKVIGSLAMVLWAAYTGYLLHAVIVYSMTVHTFGGISPVVFFKGMMPAILFAFSSASSVGTLGHLYLADTGGTVPGKGDGAIKDFLTECEREGYEGRLSLQISFRDCILAPDKWIFESAEWLKNNYKNS